MNAVVAYVLVALGAAPLFQLPAELKLDVPTVSAALKETFAAEAAVLPQINANANVTRNRTEFLTRREFTSASDPAVSKVGVLEICEGTGMAGQGLKASTGSAAFKPGSKSCGSW